MWDHCYPVSAWETSSPKVASFNQKWLSDIFSNPASQPRLPIGAERQGISQSINQRKKERNSALRSCTWSRLQQTPMPYCLPSLIIDIIQCWIGKAYDASQQKVLCRDEQKPVISTRCPLAKSCATWFHIGADCIFGSRSIYIYIFKRNKGKEKHVFPLRTHASLFLPELRWQQGGSEPAGDVLRCSWELPRD